jgi:2-haloacid dehalogenase
MENGTQTNSANFGDGRLGIEGVLFDVQGTLVDFYSTLLREGARIGEAKGIEADWAEVADAWRLLYREGLDAVIGGRRPWQTTDHIYRQGLDVLLERFPWGAAFSSAERDQLTAIWRALDPWPDTRPGLTRLRERLVLSTLSNGSMRSVIGIVKSGGLPFDCVLTSELVRSFKPDPKVYQLAVDALGLPPERLLMVACHKYDLKAAKALGFRTAFIRRPLEFGPQGVADLGNESYFDLAVDTVGELAEHLFV